MVSLQHNPPLFFTWVSGGSKSDDFLEFVVKCMPYLQGHEYFIGDNASIHVNGDILDTVVPMLASMELNTKHYLPIAQN